MNRREPLKFRPSLREKIWGTQDLRPVLGQVDGRIGEAWCLHDGSEVAHGPLSGRRVDLLLAEFGHRIMGPSWPDSGGDGPRLPIIAKLLFCAENLSIQVHPDDWQSEDRQGKTELWYVIAAEPGARLGLSLDAGLDPERLANAAKDGSIDGLMNWVPARPGQCVLLPAGTMHSAGGGAVLCEIQQNSDVTYRLYDYERSDFNGRRRTLDVERAIEAADMRSRPVPETPRLVEDGNCRVESLGKCPYFVTELLSWDSPFIYIPDQRRSHVLVCIEGYGSMAGIPFEGGDAFLVPAEAARFPVDGVGAQAVRAHVP